MHEPRIEPIYRGLPIGVGYVHLHVGIVGGELGHGRAVDSEAVVDRIVLL